MKKYKMYVTVLSDQKHKVYDFVGVIHERAKQEDFALSISDFYEKHGKAIPSCPHFEIEVLEPGKKVLRDRELHIHDAEKSSEAYVCYPKAIPTLQEAEDKFKIWCLGSVSRTDFGIECDLEYVHAGFIDDTPGFYRMMYDRFGIRITFERVLVVGQ